MAAHRAWVEKMRRESAKEISDLMVDIGRRLNESLRNVQAKESEADFRAYRDAVSKIMMAMLEEVMTPLYAEHPEVKPPELK